MRILAALTATLIFSAVLPADRITLKNGASHDGTFLSGTSASIVFRDGNGVRHRFPVGDIQNISFGNNYPATTGSANRSARESERPYNYTSGTRILPAGTQLSVRTDETIDSRNATEGQTFSATIEKDVMDDAGNVVIPRGSPARLVIRQMQSGSTTGSPHLVLDFDSVTVDGQRYLVSTEEVTQSAQSGIGKNRRTAEMVGGSAALGTLLGAIAGGGKGAAIGAIAGAAAGGAVQVLTKGKEVRVPAETMLTFRLDQPLRLRPV